jgi:hypothetical protein
VKPSHGEPPGISARDDERRALVEQRETLLQILELGQKDFHAGDFRDLDEFLEELDSDSPDVSPIVSFSAELFWSLAKSGVQSDVGPTQLTASSALYWQGRRSAGGRGKG